MAVTLFSNLMVSKVLFSMLFKVAGPTFALCDSTDGLRSRVKPKEEDKLTLPGIIARHAFCSEPRVFLSRHELFVRLWLSNSGQAVVLSQRWLPAGEDKLPLCSLNWDLPTVALQV